MEKIPFVKEKIQPYIKELAENKRNLALKSINCLGGGSYGLAFELKYIDGFTEIIKAFKISEMLKTEAESLRLLKEASSLKIPEVYYLHQANNEIPIDAMAMERILGVNGFASPFFIFYPAKNRKFFADTITDALGKIHETTGEKYGFIDATGKAERYDSWQEFYIKFANDVYEKAKAFHKEKKLDDKIFNALELGIKNIDFILQDKVERPSLLHGDLNVFNIMVDKKTLAPTGIIDPFNSMWGDKEYDLFQFNAIAGKRFMLYETYKNKFQTTPKVDLKCAFYALVNEILCHMKSGWSSKFLYATILKRLKKQYKKYGIQ